jgi:peptidoglycan-associated lipoprotein
MVKKNQQGFITVALLVLMASVVLIGSSKSKVNDQERYNFYGEYISPKKEQQLLAKDVFYFDFNSHILKQSDSLPLLAHTRKLLQEPKLTVSISGHTDEKGSKKYNLNLGLSRAQAIADQLYSNGISLSRINMISYADQVPAINAAGSDADIAKLNRRAEIVYQFKEKK